VGVLIEVINPGGVEAAGPALYAVHGVALLQQQLSQVRPVLAGDGGDLGGFGHRHLFNSKTHQSTNKHNN